MRASRHRHGPCIEAPRPVYKTTTSVVYDYDCDSNLTSKNLTLAANGDAGFRFVSTKPGRFRGQFNGQPVRHEGHPPFVRLREGSSPRKCASGDRTELRVTP